MALLPLIGIGLGAAATVLGISGQREATRAQQRNLEEQARQAKRAAALVKEQAKFNAEIQAIQAQKLLGQTKTAFAAAGVEGGSIFNILAESSVNAELDRLNILFEGEVRSQELLAGAAGASRAASSVGRAGAFEQLATGLRGAASIASMWPSSRKE